MAQAKRHTTSVSALCIMAALYAVFLLFNLYTHANALAADVARSFSANVALTPGTIVSLAPGGGNTVEPANSKNELQPIGVVVSKDSTLVNIDSFDNSVQVAVSGKANVLVSNLQGAIKSGDLIAESPISGVGVAARAGQKVIGVAQSDFNESSANTSMQTIKSVSGKEQEVLIGSVPLIIAVGTGASTQNEYGNGIKGLLSEIGGKPVSASRIIMTGFISLLTLVALVVMITAAVKNGVSGTSRNPLAKPVIFESLAQVFVMIILISIVSLVINYAILRL